MKRLHWVALTIITIITLIAQYSVEEHHHWWDVIPAFYAIYGFIGCLLIVVVSKWFGKRIAFRNEDYYDR
jgi:hypothetical protein